METIKMNPELKSIWIAALRDGSHIQAEGVLFEGLTEDGRPKMCCLGVLEHVCGNEIEMFNTIDESDREILHMPDDLRDARKSPKDVLNQSWEDKSWNGDMPPYKATLGGYLAHMNDYGATFNQIADYIEKHI
jgi:hypothetical protein